MTHVEDTLLSMTKYGKLMSETAGGILGGDDLVSNVSLSTLMLLHRDGPQRPTRIAELTGLTSGGATKLITRLETAGLVVREEGIVQSDGRAIVVTLTETGTEKMREVVVALTPQIEALVGELDAIRIDA